MTQQLSYPSKTVFCLQKITCVFLFSIFAFLIRANAQTPVPMASQPGLTYTENFADIANWGTNFSSGIGANRWGSVAVNATGSIPDGVKTTTATSTFSTGTSGGVQKGTGNIVLLSTGATDNTTADAIDFFLDFSTVSAGTLSFNWATVFNSTGDRNASIRVYTSTNGTTFTELTAAAVLNKANNVAASGAITTVALPASFNGSATARIRFYEYNGVGGTTGSRAKLSIDSVIVTATSVVTPSLVATFTSLSFVNQVAGTTSASKIDSLSGTNLTGTNPDSAQIIAPADYQVSKDNVNWGSSAYIVFTPPTLVKTPFYVRFTPQTSGQKNQSVTFSGGGVTTPPTVSVTGYSTDSLAPILYAVTGSTYTENFNGLPSATSPVFSINGSGPYYLADTPLVASGARGWQYGTFGTMRFIVSDGSGTSPTGATYSYGTGVTAERALGSYASGSSVPFYGAIIKNTTSDILRNVTISYTGEQWHRGSGSANTLTFSYRLGASSIADTGFTGVGTLNFTSPITTGTNAGLDGNAGANRTVIAPQTFILNGNWMPGQNLVIRWNDTDDGLNDDGLAVDDLSFSALPPSVPTQQDSMISFSNVSTYSLTANWLNGNGSNRIVIMNTTNSFTNPVDGTTPSANPNYSGSGEQVIYNGSGSSVNLTGLLPGNTYYFRVFAYNGSGISSRYTTVSAPNNPNSQTTVAAAAPTQLVVTSVNGGNAPFQNGPFYVVVQSMDGSGNLQNAISNTGLSVTLINPVGGPLSGTLTGVLSAGTHIDTLYGIVYGAEANGVILRITSTSGDALGFANTPPFNVTAVATQLAFSGTPASGIINTPLASFSVLALTDGFGLDQNYNGDITISMYSGPGTMTGTFTRTAVAGVATFNDIQFDVAGSYFLEADATNLIFAFSSEIVITNVPVLTELVVPKYIGSKTTGSGNTNRTTIAVCLQVDNLVPGITYDIRAGLDTVNAPSTSFGVGNSWSGTAYNTSLITNAFTANGSGSSGPFWIYIQPTANASRYGGGQVHNLRIGYVATGGQAPSTPNFVGSKTITSLDIQSSATATTSDDGAFLTGTAIPCAAGKYILIYDNVAGSGDPLFAYQARQAIPTDTSNFFSLPVAVRDIYRQNGTSSLGSWPAVIPIGANNPNGVRRVEARNADNTIFSASTDSDGVWPSGANTTTVTRFGVVTLTSGDASLSTVAITNVSSTPASCPGTNDGTATVTATGNGLLTYSWNTSPVQTSATATGLGSGTYTVTVSDASGCTATASATVTQPSTSTITASGPTTFCSGDSVTLSVAAGANSYSWASVPAGLSSTLNSVVIHTSGSYSVTVTTGSCTQTSAPTVVTVNGFAYNGTIFSESMGQPSGNTLINSYTGWQNAAPITFSSASATQSDVRKSNPFLAIPGVSDSGNVFFSSSGARDFIISGINTLTYSNLQLTFQLRRDQGTTADPMIVEVSDNGAAYTALTITQPSALNTWRSDTAVGSIPQTSNLLIRFRKAGSTSSYRLDDVKLTGTTGTISVSANGPTTFCSGGSVLLTSNILTGNTWSPGNQTTRSVSVSASGNYFVTVTGTNGCTGSSVPVSVVVIPNPSAPSVNVTHPTCTVSTGTITVTSPLGAGLSYSIDSITYTNTTGIFNNLAPGNYSVFVKNSFGCISPAAHVTVNPQPAPLVIETTVTQITCAGANNGSITANATTGTGPYTYAWNNVATDSVVLIPTKDNSIYERNQSNSNGAGIYFVAGETGQGFKNRALMAFDIAGNIPAGAIITNVSLDLHCSQTSGSAGAQDFDLYKLSQNWGEGTSNAGAAGTGTAASPNDATWLSNFFGVSSWTNAGGTFAGLSSGTQSVDAIGFYSWSSVDMVSDVQNWLDNAGSNDGWLLKGTESGTFQAKRFDSKENSTTASRPVLRVTYTTAITSNTQSNLGAGTYEVTVTDANGCTGTASVTLTEPINSCATTDTLNLKVFIEGPYTVGPGGVPTPGFMATTLYDLFTNSIGNNDDPTATDTITVGLWYDNPDSLNYPDPGFADPDHVLPGHTSTSHSARVVLHYDGTATAIFDASGLTGNNYYISINTRNALETWSKVPVTMGPSVNYDFTTSLLSAWDDGFNPPLKALGGGLFGIYSSDINQDGGIDGNDMNFIDNNPGAFGYDPSDVNGDMGTDGNDMNFADNNGILGLFYARPF
jgi:hypothetical protein